VRQCRVLAGKGIGALDLTGDENPSSCAGCRTTVAFRR
jgi:hypothetical protein